jgi:hypothetical protein
MPPRIGLGSGDRGSLDSDEFETCPVWVPGVDVGRRAAVILMKTILFQGFDHRANWVAKVRNVSRLGSH